MSKGPRGAASALYRVPRSADEPLVRCGQGLPEWFTGNVDTGCLVSAGSAVAAADRGAVYTSDDAGESWQTLTTALPPVRSLTTLGALERPVPQPPNR